jgi:hypothetical protein
MQSKILNADYMKQREKVTVLEEPEFPTLAIDIRDPTPPPNSLPLLHAAAGTSLDARSASVPAAE